MFRRDSNQFLPLKKFDVLCYQVSPLSAHDIIFKKGLPSIIYLNRLTSYLDLE